MKNQITFMDVAECDGLNVQDDRRGFYMWLILRDGSEALWCWDWLKPHSQTCVVIDNS